MNPCAWRTEVSVARVSSSMRRSWFWGSTVNTLISVTGLSCGEDVVISFSLRVCPVVILQRLRDGPLLRLARF